MKKGKEQRKPEPRKAQTVLSNILDKWEMNSVYQTLNTIQLSIA